MLKLKRLKITKFRHVEPTELFFDDRYTVPLGINGSGKTTLLKLISACLRSDFAAYKEEELDLEYEVHAAQTRYRVEVANAQLAAPMPNTHSEIDAGRRAALNRASWRSQALIFAYLPEAREATIAVGKRGLTISIGERHEELLDEDRVATPTEGPFLMQALDRAFRWLEYEASGLVWPEPPGVLTELFGADWCYRFDESLSALNVITGHPTAPDNQAIPEPYLQCEFTRADFDIGPWDSCGHARTFVPGTLADEVEREVSATTPSEKEPSADLRLNLEPPFIKAFVSAASFIKGAVTLDVIEKKPDWTRQGPSIKIRFGHFGFRFHTKEGHAIAHELLSYGQKRLLSFLYYVACNDAVVVADELVNGLHHAWIEVCLDAIGERQAFLTSQNPILLDFLPPASPEEAQCRFIRCVPEEREGRDVMVWRNLTPDEATELCANYAAGIQQLSDLLRIQGLW